jgi:hypothetical protein
MSLPPTTATPTEKSIDPMKSLLLAFSFVLIFCEPTVAQEVAPVPAGTSPATSTPPQVPGIPPEIARWEATIAKLEERNAEEDVAGDRILYYGSSSIRLWRSIVEDMAPWPAVQRGYGGAKLPDIIHYAPRVIGPHLGESNPRRCRALVVFVANDITGRDTDASSEQVASLFSDLHTWIRKQDATIPLFWIEVTPTQSRWSAWPQIEESTKRIGQIIDGDKNAHLISTAGAYLGLDGMARPELFRRDQLHLTPDGYQQWAILIKAQLHAKLGATEPLAIERQETAELEPNATSEVNSPAASR